MQSKNAVAIDAKEVKAVYLPTSTYNAMVSLINTQPELVSPSVMQAYKFNKLFKVGGRKKSGALSEFHLAIENLFKIEIPDTDEDGDIGDIDGDVLLSLCTTFVKVKKLAFKNLSNGLASETYCKFSYKPDFFETEKVIVDGELEKETEYLCQYNTDEKDDKNVTRRKASKQQYITALNAHRKLFGIEKENFDAVSFTKDIERRQVKSIYVTKDSKKVKVEPGTKEYKAEAVKFEQKEKKVENK